MLALSIQRPILSLIFWKSSSEVGRASNYEDAFQKSTNNPHMHPWFCQTHVTFYHKVISACLIIFLTNNGKNSPDLESDLCSSVSFLLESLKLSKKEEREKRKRNLIRVNGKHKRKCIKVNCQEREGKG